MKAIIKFLLLIILFGCNNKEINQIKNGKKHGIWKEYFSNYKLSDSTNYDMYGFVQYDNGQLSDTVFLYYKGGQLKHKGLLYSVDTIVPQNFFKTYNKDGLLISEEEFKYGMKNGISIYYDYKNSKKIINKKENYLKGKLNGFVKIFFPNNSIKEHFTYSNDVKNGFFYRNNESGNRLFEGNFKKLQNSDLIAESYMYEIKYFIEIGKRKLTFHYKEINPLFNRCTLEVTLDGNLIHVLEDYAPTLNYNEDELKRTLSNWSEEAIKRYPIFKLKSNERLVKFNWGMENRTSLTRDIDANSRFASKTLKVPNGKIWILLHVDDYYYYENARVKQIVPYLSVNKEIIDWSYRRKFSDKENIDISRAKIENLIFYSNETIKAISNLRKGEPYRGDFYDFKGEIWFLELNSIKEFENDRMKYELKVLKEENRQNQKKMDALGRTERARRWQEDAQNKMNILAR